MKMKRIIAFLLTVSMLLTFNATAFATGANSELTEEAYSFTDGEGKINTVYVSSEERGTAHVDYYIDGTLISTVDVAISDTQEADANSIDNLGSVRISYTDVEKSETKVFTDLVSKYVSESQISNRLPSGVEPAAAAASYIYQGRINYNTNDSFGYEDTDSLYIYQMAGSSWDEYQTINAELGDLASIVIAVIAAALTVHNPIIKAIASELFTAAVFAAGTTVVGGIVQGTIKKTYYVTTTQYKVKARDIKTSREQIYDAESYHVKLNGGGYSSEYYYDGYLPWDSNAVAYWMFCDFWGYSYPGVNSYTY